MAAPPAAHSAIEIKDLRFTYPDGRQALRGIDLTVQEGEKVAIVGPNGAGKSTFFLHLNGLMRGQGVIRILGQELDLQDGKGISRIRAMVGLVFQDPDDQLFSTTVYEDVAFGPIYMGLPQQEVQQRVAEALSLVDLRDYGQRMPHHLSGGEKKRAAIATVLSMDPKILALDEPSAGLDPRARRGLIKLLADLPQTVLVATHDMHMVREVFPRTIVLDGGIVVADGPTKSILSDQALLEAHGLELP
jgi:cobalt transport protein ATP-binding subunit